MTYEVIHSRENRRGCGYRSPGKSGVGIYLVGIGIFEPCERLPFPMSICSACGEGIRFFRGIRWIDPTRLFAPDREPICDHRRGHSHALCSICSPEPYRQALMWIGKGHYPTPESFLFEAQKMGVSKKVAAVPTGFEFGKNIIYLIHPEAFRKNGQDPAPGIFMSFRPIGVHLVIDDPDNIADRAKKIVDRLGDNARLMTVEPIPETKRNQLILETGGKDA